MPITVKICELVKGFKNCIFFKESVKCCLLIRVVVGLKFNVAARNYYIPLIYTKTTVRLHKILVSRYLNMLKTSTLYICSIMKIQLIITIVLCMLNSIPAYSKKRRIVYVEIQKLYRKKK